MSQKFNLFPRVLESERHQEENFLMNTQRKWDENLVQLYLERKSLKDEDNVCVFAISVLDLFIFSFKVEKPEKRQS